MRAVVQRVLNASVLVDKNVVGQIEHGLMVLIGFEETDDEDDISWLTKKITELRIFNDDRGVMNLNLLDTKGALLLVSQFTLHASFKKGRRPSYIRSAKPSVAQPLYNKAVSSFSAVLGQEIETGIFGAQMQLVLTNDGPVTIFIDTKNKE